MGSEMIYEQSERQRAATSENPSGRVPLLKRFSSLILIQFRLFGENTITKQSAAITLNRVSLKTLRRVCDDSDFRKRTGIKNVTAEKFVISFTSLACTCFNSAPNFSIEATQFSNFFSSKIFIPANKTMRLLNTKLVLLKS